MHPGLHLIGLSLANTIPSLNIRHEDGERHVLQAGEQGLQVEVNL